MTQRIETRIERYDHAPLSQWQARWEADGLYKTDLENRAMSSISDDASLHLGRTARRALVSDVAV